MILYLIKAELPWNAYDLPLSSVVTAFSLTSLQRSLLAPPPWPKEQFNLDIESKIQDKM